MSTRIDEIPYSNNCGCTFYYNYNTHESFDGKKCTVHAENRKKNDEWRRKADIEMYRVILIFIVFICIMILLL